MPTDTSAIGHVKINRRAYATDPFWTEPRVFSRWEAWEWMIQAAAWKDHERVIGMAVVPIRRGEVLASVRFLGKAWGWKKDRVSDFLHLLEKMARISRQQETPHGTVYMLVNYDTYQSTPDSKPTANPTASRQQADSEPTKEKKGKQVSMGVSARATRTHTHARVSEWHPNEQHEKLAGEYGVDLRHEERKFRDYAPNREKPYKDLDAGFRNWLHNAWERAGKPRPRREQAEQEEFI